MNFYAFIIITSHRHHREVGCSFVKTIQTQDKRGNGPGRRQGRSAFINLLLSKLSRVSHVPSAQVHWILDAMMPDAPLDAQFNV